MKLRFWTIQKLDVVTALLQYKTYQPAFAYSDYVQEDPGLSELYGLLLDSYNRANNTDHPGLVFTFLGNDDDDNIFDFKDYATFCQFIIDHSFAIKSLWNHLASKNTVIMCVEKELDSNLLLIDINDFQCLMPPIMISYPYTEDNIRYLIQNFSAGNYIRSVAPSNLLQAHIPDIKAEEVIGLYPMFTL